jgi:hypothetical protein
MNVTVTVNGGIQVGGLVVGEVRPCGASWAAGLFHARVSYPVFWAEAPTAEEAAELAVEQLADWWEDVRLNDQGPWTDDAEDFEIFDLLEEP